MKSDSLNRLLAPAGVSVVHRTAGERTACISACLLKRQLTAKQYTHISESPLSKAALKSIEIHLDNKADYGVNVDGDVLVRPGALATLTDLMQHPDLHSDVAFCRLLCDLHGGYAFVGLRILTRRALQAAYPLARKNVPRMRPDVDVISELRRQGYISRLHNCVLGIHDYEQYYGHIYVKMYNRAQKSISVYPLLERLRHRAPCDLQAKAGYMGLLHGLKDCPAIKPQWVQDFPYLKNVLFEAGVLELDPLPETSFGYDVEKRLAEYQEDRHSVSWEVSDKKLILKRGKTIYSTESL